MSKSYQPFAYHITGLVELLGISHIDYLKVAVGQARYYGFEDLADWYEESEAKLRRSIEEEWHVVDTKIT